MGGVQVNDLEVVEEDVVIAPLSIEPVGGWRVVVFLEQVFSTPLVVKAGAMEIGRQAEALTGLGSVEVFLGGEEITRSLPPTRDPMALEEALSWIALRETGLSGQLAIRDRFLASPYVAPLVADREAAVSATAGRLLADLARTVRSAVRDEADLVEANRLRFLNWLAEEAGPPNTQDTAPRLLIYVSSGWDEHDVGFYEKMLSKISMQDAVEGVNWPAVEASLGETARAVAALGWVVVGFTPSELIDLQAAEEGDGSTSSSEEDKRVETVVQDGREVDRTLFKPSLDPRDLFKRRTEAEIEAELSAPLAVLERLADDSSGSVVTDGRQLGREIERLAGRYRVTYESASSSDDLKRVEVRRAGGSGRTEIRSDLGLSKSAKISAPRWTAGYPPRILSRARARRVMEEESGDGDLMISAVVEPAGTLRVEWLTDTESENAAGAGPLRVTVATAGTPRNADQFIVTQSELQLVELQPVDDVAGAYLFRMPFQASLDSDFPSVVVVEDLGLGLWGSSHVRSEEAAGAESATTTDDLAPSYVLPAPKAVHLLAPKPRLVMGTIEFETVVSDTRVNRVDFLLDGQLAVSRRMPPFSARLDLGRLPQTRRVEAVAYSGDGKLLGRDALVINEGSGSFRVRILDPAAGSNGDSSRPRTGPVDVEATVRVPRGNRLERLDFFWKEELAGTRYTPPYSQRIFVPAESPAGFVRVVGHLMDGSTTEDVVFFNSPEGSERLRVELVELYTVVTDRQGRPVMGLGRDDFEVVEDGERQEISTFGDAGDQPLTVGLAIDSSASMFVKLPDVQNAAARFLDGLAAKRDRAFVVGFGDEAFLQKDTTSDLAAARQALFSLRPAGRTSIWKGIVYSLVQLQGVPGKKALIVYSDGADEDPNFSYRTCLEFARRVGVPLYVVVSNDEIYRTAGKGLTIRGFMNRLESLTRNVGGRVFVTRVGEDLEAIYQEVDREIRSQYLIGYYADETEDEAWREVAVRVDSPGARARTISGYYR